MTTFAPRDPAFESRVRASFARTRFMTTLGAELAHVRAGRTLTVCAGEVRVAGRGDVVAVMQATMMAVRATTIG